MIKSTAILSCFICLCDMVNGQCGERYLAVQSDSFALRKDIYFGENISENGEPFTLLLDVFEPAAAAEPQASSRPLVILVHGGSFTGGEKEMGEVAWICEDLARRGIVAASINYRTESNPLSLLSEEKMAKAVMRGVEDTKAAIRFFYKSVEEGNPYGIDPASIILGGTSAGSICGLHAVYLDEFQELRPKWQRWMKELGIDTLEMNGNSGNPGYPDSVRAVINISGAIARVDFLDNNMDIPILNVHNTIDLTIPFQYGHPYFIPTLPIVAGSRPIHYRMLDGGGHSRLLVFEEINHIPYTNNLDGSQLQPQYDEALDEILRFVGDISPCDALPTPVVENGKSLRAYPNPASSHIRVEGLENGEAVRFDIYSSGGILAAGNLEMQNGTVMLPDGLARGFYFLTGRDGAGGTHVLKLVVGP